jgi:hypothetical protein
MKRILTILVIGLLISAGAWAQSSDMSIEELQAGFDSFSAGVASTLGSAASTGLNWSTAYIGQLPHLGIGVTVGAALIPYETIGPILTTFGASIPTDTEYGALLTQYGVPLPAVVADARIGGLFLPFDIGLKVGLIPTELQSEIDQYMSLDYLMWGADVRFALLDGKGLKPALSVGAGYTYYRGSIGIPDLAGTGSLGSVDISQAMVYSGYPAGTYTLSMSSPELVFNWESSVLEVKAQLSKTLLFITPSVGVKAAYAISTAGGGIVSKVVVDGPGNPTVAQVNQVLAAAGLPAVTDQGITSSSSANGWAFVAFGGLDIALLILHVDASVNYNLISKALGGSVNVRLAI